MAQMSIIKMLSKELAEHEIKMLRQEARIEAEQSKLSVMRACHMRWQAQLEELERQEKQTGPQPALIE